MNINLIEHLAKTVTPALLDATVDKSESSMLNQLFAILLGRFTDGGVTSKVFDAYNKLTSNGSINPSDLSADSLSSLSSLVWKDDSQADSIVSNLAENHGIGAGKVKGLMASALPLVLGQLKGLAGDKPVAQYLADQPQGETSFTNYIPNWAMSMLPAGLLGAGAVAAKAVTSKVADTKPAYAASTNTTTKTTVTRNEKKGGGFLKGLLPLLGLLLLAALAYALLKGCQGGEAEPVAAPVEETTEVVEETTDAVVDGAAAVTGAVVDGAEAVVDGAADATGAVADGAEAVVDGVAGTLASWFTNPDDLAIAEKLNMQIIHFNTNGDAISGENQAILDNTVDAMTKLADAKLAVTGYTDVRGDEAYNQALSLERAESVKDYLVSKGVAADRITTAGAGETTEFSAADTAEGLYENRRITFAVSK